MTSWLSGLFGGERDREVRSPEFAGVQYPESADRLEEMVRRHLEAAGDLEIGGRRRAVVAPYGDYDYAGPSMGAAHAAAPTARERVVLVGSSTRVPFRGVAVARYDAFETPLGEVALDRDAMASLVEEELARPIEAAFEPAASIELQLPFLQVVLDDPVCLPLLVGDGRVDDVADVLAEVVDERTWLVAAANLSEGHAAEEAEEIDAETAEALERLDGDGIERGRTSARRSLRALVELAGRRGWTVRCRRRETSAETAGRDEKVVGYGVFDVSED